MADNQTNIAIELARILQDRDTIRAKLYDLKIISNLTADLDECAAALLGVQYVGNVTATVQIGKTYHIPAGFHDGTGTVSGVQGEGDFKLQSKTVTPNTSRQVVTNDDGWYGLSDVTVEPIPSNYKDVSSVTVTKDKVLATERFVDKDGNFDTGTMPNIGAVAKVLDASTTSYDVDEGYHNGKGRVSIVPEEKTVTPLKTQQNVTPTSGKVLTRVVVAPIPDLYIDTTIAADEAAAANTMLAGTKAWVNGALVEGTILDLGPADIAIDGMTTMGVDIPAGYTQGGRVYLTDDIYNILKDI